MGRMSYISKAAAIRFLIVAAFAFIATPSCTKKAEVVSDIDLLSMPKQVADSMIVNQTTNGKMSMRMVAPRMEKYENDSISYELFPSGFDIYSYDGGVLETQVHALQAKHIVVAKTSEEEWAVFGNVVITNFLKGEQMFTDTLYWDRFKQKIYTHCFVKMSSPMGYMQGYGLESDENARNARILAPFDSFGRLEELEYIDTVNFIGPLLKKQ